VDKTKAPRNFAPMLSIATALKLALAVATGLILLAL